ncbi:MAG: trimethylamine methyltransferase family protein, partial [Alphaproteobacteria bacterium]|nr:trimethylamine methyltransferase family protein [Alphaproteobacteria bacterium]
MTNTEQTASGAEPPRRGRRDSSTRRAGSGRGAIQQLPRRRITRAFPPMSLVSADEIESIHQASLQVLSEIGMDFTLPEARDLLKAAGADVQGERVRFDPALVEQLISTAPAQFTFHARNPENSRLVGGNDMLFGPVSSPPNCADVDGGRRAGNLKDYRNFLRLAQYFNCIHYLGGYPVEPIDIHASIRHLEALRDAVLLTDKPFHAYSLGSERIRDGIEIARIGRGISAEQMEREPSLFTIVNTNSPLKLDSPMLGGIMEMSARNQIVCI